MAVLGQPDPQGVPDDITDAYEELMEERAPLRLETMPDPRDSREMPAPQTAMPVWLLSIQGGWERCAALRHGRSLVITGSPDAGAPGTSGSPVLIGNGCVVGVVNTGGEIEGQHMHTTGTVLADGLPGWLLKHVLETEA